MQTLNETHDPALQSWVASANAPGTDFPIQNLPFAVFRRAGTGEAFRGGVAIGDAIVDLAAASASGAFDGSAAAAAQAAAGDSLNALMALGPEAWSALAPGAVAGAARWRDGRACAGAAALSRRRTSSTRSPRASATTPTSTRRSTTRRTSASSSGPTTRCCRTTSGCRSAITGARRASASSGQAFRAAGRADDAAWRSRRRSCGRAGASTTSSRSGSSSAAAMRPASRSRSPTPSRMCSASACSTTGRRATSRPGSTSRSVRSSRRTSRPRISPWIVTLEALAPYRVPFERARRRPATAGVPRLFRQPGAGCLRLQLQVLHRDTADARCRAGRRAACHYQLPTRVLDGRADGRAPHRQRLQSAARRPARQRHRCRDRRWIRPER